MRFSQNNIFRILAPYVQPAAKPANFSLARADWSFFHLLQLFFTRVVHYIPSCTFLALISFSFFSFLVRIIFKP